MKTLLLLTLLVHPQLEPPNLTQETPVPKEIHTRQLPDQNPGKGKKLFKKLSEQTLIALTDNENAGVRCSAFLGLVKLNSSKVKDIFLNHLEDDERLLLGFIWSFVAEYEQVNQFMLEQLHPEKSKSSYKLTVPEYDKYREQIY